MKRSVVAAAAGRVVLLGSLLCSFLSFPAEAGAEAVQLMRDPTCGANEWVRWRGGPTTWFLNEEGARDLEFDVVQRIFEDAFEAWSEPCCSGFTSQFMGTTPRRRHQPVVENLIYFEGESWPPEMGNSKSVIGVTSMTRGRCSMHATAIVFNEIDYTFTDTDQGLSRGDVDLRWVGLHEVGHWIGLDHSESSESIMQRRYLHTHPYNGLSQLDIDAVCTVYPGSCEGCEANDDCPDRSICKEGACIAAECRDTLDCPMGTICEDGSCDPGCRFHGECPDGEICLEGECAPELLSCEKHVDCEEGEACVGRRCREQPSACTTCQLCFVDTDCSPHEHCALPREMFAPGVCTNQCESDADCVGNTECRRLPGVVPSLCLDYAFNDPNTACRRGFSCGIGEPGPTLGCALLGQPCTGGSFGCGGRSDTCIELEDRAMCSCTCRSDDECGERGRCLVDPSTDLPSCFPVEELLPCGASFCFPGELCTEEEECLEDPCAGIQCAEGESCVEGSCQPPPADPKSGAGSKKGSSCTSSGGAAFSWSALFLAAGLLARSRRRAARGS